MRPVLRTLSLSLLIGAAGAAAAAIGEGPVLPGASAAPPPTSFSRQVLPILEQRCVVCHSPSGVGYKAIGLDLRSYEGVMAGSIYGVAVIPRHPELSPLIAVIQKNRASFKNLKMPPIGKLLSSAEIDMISRWIAEGAKDN